MYRNEETIFEAALQYRDPAERQAYVVQACGTDAKLQGDVEALLQAHDSQSLLDAPVLEYDPRRDAPKLPESPGTVIGRYKLLEKIGEGGMAVVYMAEQQEPIRRKVALKIIKLGMDTRQVIARFEAERQALAMMDHPSIAKVFDAGATETGRPYFVMELVSGVSITEYCDKNNLSTKDRLSLFLQVCHAVQHAHQKGIIHRDLKPSNVMVTHHDGQPVPKVIDFGIAKATNQKLTEKTLFTRYAHVIGTPAYMSPEQAELSDLDVDTRTDIYSLGVLLYELLTGTTPFSEEELRKAGYVEMQRVIREQEPVKPSTRIRTALRGASVPARRGTGILPVVLRGEGILPLLFPFRGQDARQTQGRDALATHGTPYQQVRGDLDWIVMKSLEKDRARRYETASGLAEDVRRHLEHEPVLARGPGTGYRLHKFLRRHRVQALAVLAMAVVAGVMVVTLSLWNRDRLQLVEAEGFRHRGILSQAREQYAKADREAALETIKPILHSRHVGSEAQLLQAGILVDNRRSDEAAILLNSLLNERPEIAGAAHSLLARILWESESPDAEKLKQVEEHRQRAEALLPETAEAYFLRAMTAVTVKEQLASLDKALQLDSGHYESRRLRAFTYYASRKYDQLHDDALVMTILRPRDPLGYSLRAVARRELGRYREAIAQYDGALALTAKGSPPYVDLSAQRCEALLRMGEYQRVIADAQECLKLAPDKPIFPYHIFCALTALGEYEKADGVFRQIVRRTPMSRNQFQHWSMKYVFDALEAGRSWHLAGHEPAGAAFLSMVEAEENYHQLSSKGRRVTTDGFNSHWSPEGKKLAFSLGVHGRSGVAIFDPATKETDLLIVPGKDPRWSPDGRYIAFVRDCQTLRLEEFTAAERKKQDRSMTDEEVWVMNAGGTAPRRLARGGWPSWSQDSTSIYYQSRVDNTLCSISITGRDAEPKRIMPCANAYPSVSPDNQRVAYLEGASLKIKDLASQALVGERPAPFATWGGAAWSPTGRELCLAGRNDSDDRTGLWIYDLDRSEPAKTLGGQITVASWAADGTKLVFCLGPPYYEVWIADLDPHVATIEVLGPGQTPAEHLQEMVALYTRRIEADPQDAYAHSNRAQYYDCLHDREKANADMRQFSAILSQGASSDLRLGTPRRLRGAIDGPFGYQLAFSVGGRDNRIPVLCIAFGQKGRCEMRVFEIPMFVTSLFGLCLFSGLDTPPAYAGFTFGEPVNLRTVIPVIDPARDGIDCLSYDGLEMYIESNRPGGYGDYDLWVLRRASIDGAWGQPENLGPAVNSSKTDNCVSISADGLTLYFQSTRAGGYGSVDIYRATRTTGNAPWGPPVNLGPKVNSSALDGGPWISPDGLELYFGSSRPGDYGGFDIYVSRRATTNDAWGDAVNLGPIVNSPYTEADYSLSPDGLLLLFGDGFFVQTPRPGGYGGSDVWMTRRATVSAPWQTPINLGPRVNSSAHESAPRISPDGSTLYFCTLNNGTFENWQAPIIPIVDFNGDGKVDLVDLVMLIDNWGTNKTLCDIGPMPWGDGKVDIEDLKVFMTYYEKENPPVKP
jgi:serine/threonine protein kinase/Tol biopolymer transport system component